MFATLAPRFWKSLTLSLRSVDSVMSLKKDRICLFRNKCKFYTVGSVFQVSFFKGFLDSLNEFIEKHEANLLV